MKKIYTTIIALSLTFIFSTDAFAQRNRKRNIVQNGGQGTKNQVSKTNRKGIYIDDIIIGSKTTKPKTPLTRARHPRTRRP